MIAIIFFLSDGKVINDTNNTVLVRLEYTPEVWEVGPDKAGGDNAEGDPDEEGHVHHCVVLCFWFLVKAPADPVLWDDSLGQG